MGYIKKIVCSIILLLLIAGLGAECRVLFPVVAAAPPVHEGDLIINGNNVTVLQDLNYFNGSIIVEENATLILRNALINFTQQTSRQYNITLRNPINGNPRLYAYNSTIATSPSFDILVMLEDNSTANINNSTITSYIDAFEDSYVQIVNSSTVQTMYGYGMSSIYVSYSTVFEWHNYESPTVQIINSTVYSILIGPISVNCTVEDLHPRLTDNWNFQNNCSVTKPDGGLAPNITMSNTTVGGWRLAFYGTSNATIFGSTLSEVSGVTGSSRIWLDATESDYAGAYYSSSLMAENSTIGQLTTQSSATARTSHSKIGGIQEWDSSQVWTNASTITAITCHDSANIDLLNSTYTTLEVNNESMAFVSWNLDIHVKDAMDQEIPNANVTAYLQNGTIADSTLSGADGWARLILREKMINASGQTDYGSYNITATYLDHLNQTLIEMIGNQEITLTLEFIIPEITTLLLMLPFLCSSAALVTVLRKINGGKSKMQDRQLRVMSAHQ